jgi:hypothetical protein
MSSYPRVFDPLDLEIIDRVYEAASARFEAQMPPSRPRDELREALRKRVMTCAAASIVLTASPSLGLRQR